jgi:predicted lysophospholipase L1 biosynthesis ABC-type transport system permease subunit
MNAVFTLLAAINAVLLGASVYSGEVAGIVTGIIAAVAAFANELFTRAEVTPIGPLEDLAAAQRVGADGGATGAGTAAAPGA